MRDKGHLEGEKHGTGHMLPLAHAKHRPLEIGHFETFLFRGPQWIRDSGALTSNESHKFKI